MRRRARTRGIAELYAALVLVAVTLSLSYVVFSQVRFPVRPQPIFVATMFEQYGSPSILRLLVNSSAPSSVSEFRLDGSSSLAGVLALLESGYAVSGSLCGTGVTTFFSVYTGNGVLSVTADGTTFIDGVQATSSTVTGGWHELIISNASSCEIVVPGGSQVSYPSSLVSTVPLAQPTPQSFVFLIPFETTGHSVTVSFDGGVGVYGF